MGANCCCTVPRTAVSPAYRRVLWAALAVNATMFVVELAAGLTAGSVSLTADALDFLGDAANYAISLAVLGMALRWRARAALLKGVSLGVLGLWVAASTAHHAVTAAVPQAEVMGMVGLVALAANVGVAILLYTYRSGDSNMRSAWICSRNDAVGNIAVMLAASGVFATGTAWPDIGVAAVIAALAVSGAVQIVRHAVEELRQERMPAKAA